MLGKVVKCPTIKNRRGGPNGQETPMSIAESVIGIADKVLGKFIPDKTLRDQLRHEMNMAFHEANLAQVEKHFALLSLNSIHIVAIFVYNLLKNTKKG